MACRPKITFGSRRGRALRVKQKPIESLHRMILLDDLDILKLCEGERTICGSAVRASSQDPTATMSPSFFHTSYKQYKDDTNHVASWLATTAKRCGYPSDLLTSAAAKKDAQTAPKLKGRARKLARDAAKAAPSKQPGLQSEDEARAKKVYTIARKDFVAWADFIASYNKPPVQVPAALLTLLNRAIALRKRHARWYSHDLSDENLKSNATPRPFRRSAWKRCATR